MKNILLILSLLAFVFTACDKTDCPYDDGCIEPDIQCVVNGIDTCIFDGENEVIEHSDTSSFRRVLIEEYTGYKCTTCPDGALEIDTLLTDFKDTLVVVSIHAGDFARPEPSKGYVTDFRTEAGEAFIGEFPIGFNPAAVVDRTEFGGNYAQFAPTWRGHVNTQKILPNIVDLNLTSVYNPGSNAIYAVADVEFLKDYSESTIVLFYAVEDTVEDVQLWAGNFIPDYVHKHVFRGTLSHHSGDFVTSEPATIGQTAQVISDPMILDPSWDASICHVVAFVYNADTKEVLQVAEAH